jgi:YVTN family beta-propeller protein
MNRDPIRRGLPAALLAAALAIPVGCGGTPTSDTAPAPPAAVPTPQTLEAHPPQLPGMPPVLDARNVYSAAGAGMLSQVARDATPLVYVPHVGSGDVWVIDPSTFTVVGRYRVGRDVQHVVPSYDMRTLYATDSAGYTITPFEPVSGTPGPPIPVIDPYNMYFTPDGALAISVAEARKELVWYDPDTWQQVDVTEVPTCAGVDHADFSMDGLIAVFSCEFAGRVIVVDVASRQVLRTIDMPTRNTRMGPQDVKLAPDGSVFYVADSDQGSVWVIDRTATQVLREIKTAHGAHGLYLDREAKRLFVTNRHAGTISVLDAATGQITATWALPAGSSPDMGNVTADGSQLWLSGRYDDEVYVVSTADGALLATIPVGDEPHGLCVWPQPGRYSLGHTGITR